MTSTEIGKKLEKDFGRFMEKELNYHEIEYNIPMNGKVSERYYDCDIHGVEENSNFRLIRKIGYIISLIALISFVFEIEDFKQISENIITSIDPSLAGSGLLLFGLAGIIIGWYGRKRESSHAWVECKEHKSKVKRIHIVKLKEAVYDVSNVSDPKWIADKIILVSKSGFDADAINFAREYGIILYKRIDNTFEEVE